MACKCKKACDDAELQKVNGGTGGEQQGNAVYYCPNCNKTLDLTDWCYVGAQPTCMDCGTPAVKQ